MIQTFFLLSCNCNIFQLDPFPNPHVVSHLFRSVQAEQAQSESAASTSITWHLAMGPLHQRHSTAHPRGPRNRTVCMRTLRSQSTGEKPLCVIFIAVPFFDFACVFCFSHANSCRKVVSGDRQSAKSHPGISSRLRNRENLLSTCSFAQEGSCSLQTLWPRVGLPAGFQLYIETNKASWCNPLWP